MDFKIKIKDIFQYYQLKAVEKNPNIYWQVKKIYVPQKDGKSYIDLQLTAHSKFLGCIIKLLKIPLSACAELKNIKQNLEFDNVIQNFGKKKFKLQISNIGVEYFATFLSQ